LKKVDLPARRRSDPNMPKRASSTPSRRVVVVRRPSPRDVYEPSGPPIGIGIGIGGGGFGGRSGGEGMSRRGGY
jgi:hypothetical protein